MLSRKGGGFWLDVVGFVHDCLGQTSRTVTCANGDDYVCICMFAHMPDVVTLFVRSKCYWCMYDDNRTWRVELCRVAGSAEVNICTHYVILTKNMLSACWAGGLLLFKGDVRGKTTPRGRVIRVDHPHT